MLTAEQTLGRVQEISDSFLEKFQIPKDQPTSIDHAFSVFSLIWENVAWRVRSDRIPNFREY
jgi:hypothetical protein